MNWIREVAAGTVSGSKLIYRVTGDSSDDINSTSAT